MQTSEDIKHIIKEAFADTVKGQGVGLREATAMDNRADVEAQAAARAQDTEGHWWELAEEWEGQLGTALSFADLEGFKFLLPATMCAALDGSLDNAHSVHFHLCVNRKPFTRPPHHGHPEYTDYLKSLHAEEWIRYFDFTPLQVHAIALFLRLTDDDRGEERELELRKHAHESSLKHARPGDYTLAWDDVVNNYREERRMVKEWMELGN